MTDADTIAAETAMDDPEQLRALAAQHRAAAVAAKAEAEVALQAAQAEAQRLVAEATRRVQQAAQRLMASDREVADLEARAGLLNHAEALRRQIAEAEHVVVALKTEYDDLAEQVAALDTRLAELGAERENAAAQLATATGAGDVDQVLAHRARIDALDEVIGALQTQRQTAQNRLTAINEADEVGELIDAARVWQTLQAELRRAENTLDPDSPRARMDAALDELRASVAAHVGRITDEQSQQPANPVLIRTGRH